VICPDRETDAEALGDGRHDRLDLLLREAQVAVERHGAAQPRLVDAIVVADQLHDPTRHMHPVLDVRRGTWRKRARLRGHVPTILKMPYGIAKRSREQVVEITRIK